LTAEFLLYDHLDVFARFRMSTRASFPGHFLIISIKMHSRQRIWVVLQKHQSEQTKNKRSWDGSCNSIEISSIFRTNNHRV